MSVVGFLVYVETDGNEDLDEVDIRVALVDYFKSHVEYADVSRVEVGPLGPIDIDKGVE